MKKVLLRSVCSADTMISHLQKENIDKKTFKLDTKESIETFIIESIAGHKLNQDEINETHKMLKIVERDLSSFKSSIKILINSIVSERFRMNVTPKEALKLFDNLADDGEKLVSGDEETLVSFHINAFLNGG